jgi:hypothetical protein
MSLVPPQICDSADHNKEVDTKEKAELMLLRLAIASTHSSNTPFATLADFNTEASQLLNVPTLLANRGGPEALRDKVLTQVREWWAPLAAAVTNRGRGPARSKAFLNRMSRHQSSPPAPQPTGGLDVPGLLQLFAAVVAAVNIITLED